MEYEIPDDPQGMDGEPDTAAFNRRQRHVEQLRSIRAGVGLPPGPAAPTAPVRQLIDGT